MGYDRGRRGRGRDKRDSFGEDSFDPFSSGAPRFGGGDDWRSPGGGDRFGGGNRCGGDSGGGRGGFGGDRGPPRGGGGGGMPAQVVGTGKGKVKFFNGQKGFGFKIGRAACRERGEIGVERSERDKHKKNQI